MLFRHPALSTIYILGDCSAWGCGNGASVRPSRFSGLSFQTDTHLLKEVSHGHEWRGPRQNGAPERMTGATCVGHLSRVKSKMAWMIHIVSFLAHFCPPLHVFCMKRQNASAQSLAKECPSQYHPPAFCAMCPECETGCQGDRAHVMSWLQGEHGVCGNRCLS